jgi:hypothetical protein
VPDLLVGSPRAVTSVGGPDGVVELRSGRHLATGLGAAVLRTWQGAPNVSLQRSRFGHAVAGGSDVDRDGVPDVVVGSPGDDQGGFDGGTVTVFSGATGGVLARFDRPAHQAFGSAVAFAGDVNADGWIDVLAGAPVNDSTFGTAYGRVHVFSGEWIARTAAGQAPATPMELFARDGDWNHDDYGSSVAPLGDLDGDGRGDFAVGAKRGGPNAGGYVHVFLGGSALPSVTIPVGSFADFFGFAIADAGDVDGDGLHELAVGAWGRDDGSGANTSHGAVELVSGAWMRASALGVPPAGPRAAWTHLGTATWDFLGTAIAAVGDLDGDGASEVAAAATQGSYDPPLGVSYVDVLSGRTGVRLFVLRGTHVEGLFGLGIAGVGDLDLDGRPDLAVGAPRDAAGGTDAGSVAIVRGFPSIGTPCAPRPRRPTPAASWRASRRADRRAAPRRPRSSSSRARRPPASPSCSAAPTRRRSRSATATAARAAAWPASTAASRARRADSSRRSTSRWCHRAERSSCRPGSTTRRAAARASTCPTPR